MKKQIIFLVLFCTSIFSFSQDRTNEVRPKSSKSNGLITKIIGWEFRENDGKWIHKNNQCNIFDCINLSCRSIAVNQKKYYILTIKETEGAYTYPKIKKGWNQWDQYRSYIFNEEEYFKLNKYELITSKFNEVITLTNFQNKFDKASFDDDIYQSIRNGEKADLNFQFQVKKISDTTIRFILPFSRGNEILKANFTFDKKYFEMNINEYKKLLYETHLQK
jgi:hypothetical protein